MKQGKVDVLLGLQWGDEGKGKVVDVLTPQYDVIARFQGGPNAGHTLEFEGEKYVGLAYKYHIVDETKELLIMNEPVCIVDYQDSGSSANMWKQYYKNPKGFAFFRKSEMKYQHGLQLFKTCIHYVSSSIISKNKSFVKESPKKLMTVLAVPFGFVLTVITKLES